MFKDSENHIVIPTGNPNNSCFIIGKSGYGKSYCAYRMIEENMVAGLRQVIIDESASYSLEELKKNGLDVGKSLDYIDLSKSRTNFTFSFPVSAPAELVEVCVSALEEAIEISSYQQSQILREVISAELHRSGQIDLFSTALMLDILYKALQNSSEESEKRDNVARLLKRMKKFDSRYSSFIVIPESDSVQIDSNEKSILLLQLSDYADGPRQQMVIFILSLIWQRVRRNHGKPPFDVIVLDEIQNIPVHKGSTLYSILREGRKFGTRALLATQYVNDYEKGRLSALLQVGTLLVFHPVFSDMNLLNELLQDDDPVDWKPLLRILKKGEAILKGEYRVKGAALASSRPILVKIGKSVLADRILQEQPDISEVTDQSTHFKLFVS